MPTLSEAAALTITDKEQENVELTRRIMEQIKRGDPAQNHWIAHESDMMRHDIRWAHAIGKAASVATFRALDMCETRGRMAQAVGMEYVAESSCSTREEYEFRMRQFTDAAEEIVYQAYTVKSSGWKAGDKNYPAYRVSVEQNAEQIERGGFEIVNDPYEGFVQASDEGRQHDDTHEYDGFAVVVGVRK